MPELEPGHRLPAMPPRPPPYGQFCHEPHPPAALRIAAGRPQFRHPRPAAAGDLDPDHTVPRPDRDRDRLPCSARAAVPDTVAEQLAHQQGGVIPARMPRAEHPHCERTDDPRPLRPPGNRHALPNHSPGHHRTRPSPAALPRETGRAAGGRRDMQAQLSRERQAAHGAASADLVRDPSVVAAPVRGRPCKADGPPHRSRPPIPVRYASVDTAIRRFTALQGDTCWDREETAR